MFSPDVSVHASVATRNPRRRQRTGSDDSVATRHNPKRLRRSGLAFDTFEPPSKKTNGDINHFDEVPLANGHANNDRSERLASADTMTLAIRHRGFKKADREKRSSKIDGSTVLVGYIPFLVWQYIDFTLFRPRMTIISSLVYPQLLISCRTCIALVRID